jgi:hypothetical protein
MIGTRGSGLAASDVGAACVVVAAWLVDRDFVALPAWMWVIDRRLRGDQLIA